MKTDILIIGSGPVGATFARTLSKQKPHAKIVMIDAGPKVSDKIGQHVKNIADPKAMENAQILSQGPKKTPYPMISVAERAIAVQRGELSADILARAGTHLVLDQIEDIKTNEMPSISMSTNLGGMGIHWTCACPTPGIGEQITIIPQNEMDEALAKAREILNVTQSAFPNSPESEAILNILNQTLGTNHAENRQAQPMPLACKTDESGNRYWTASDVILGNTLENPNFELRSETICRRLVIGKLENGEKTENPNYPITNNQFSITGAEIEHIQSGKKETIEAEIVIVAADPLRTPQLLWASGIRPKALGHYLNEHPFVFTFVELDKDLVRKFAPNRQSSVVGRQSPDPTVGVFWVPFDAPNHPFHGQIMHMDLSPMKTTVSDESKHIVGLGWGCLKESNFEDQIVFSETEKDFYGMPKMNFKFQFSDTDLANIEAAKAFQKKVVNSFGKEIKDGGQTLMPPGTSLHYEGTTRMGTENDGESVCDTYSQVWNFENLFVGGNGVIPIATSSNPTLVSVALAVRSSEKISQLI
ncbi:pyranose oxidase [Arcicella aurantiaca]|uniref:Pyranose oxidase n=1 Tax=Arcicella aurantiaca TaxID=591202 RepID=A0A316DWB6_9BACT|nr:GMC oxidoreductase [Arcicella aurantiaca]PWK21622.1 pyranose oxidase [Arcicella aurantiaca]